MNEAAVLRLSAAMLRDPEVCGPANSHSEVMEKAATRIETLEADLKAAREATVPGSARAFGKVEARVQALEREVRYLRTYGNKDCTGMADEAMQRGELGSQSNPEGEQ